MPPTIPGSLQTALGTAVALSIAAGAHPEQIQLPDLR
jgi:hypothetical protein